jgi:hypothetical protein
MALTLIYSMPIHFVLEKAPRAALKRADDHRMITTDLHLIFAEQL